MTIQLPDLLGAHATEPLHLATLAAMAATDRAARLDRIRSLIPATELSRWMAFATRNQVAPIVAHAMIDAYADAAPLEAQRLHDAATERMRVLLSELDTVATRLAAEDIPLVALKNAGIARGIFPCAGCCPMGDVDTLVSRERFRDAHRLIVEAGFELSSRAPDVEPADLEHGLGSGGTEYRKVTGGHEVWFELQWRAVAGRWIRADQEPEPEALIARSVAIPGSDIRLLCPEDNLLQVCLHTAKHTYVRAPGLRLHTDVDRLTLYTPPDWARFVESVRDHAVQTPVYFSLALAHALLGTPIPADALTTLSPPRWKRELVTRWLRRIDVFEPDARKFRRPDMMVFHALLYDTAGGLLASALDTTPDQLGDLRAAPRHLARGVARMRDLVTRFQR